MKGYLRVLIDNHNPNSPPNKKKEKEKKEGKG